MEYRIIFGITFGIAFVFYVIFSIDKSNIYCFNIFNQSFTTNMGKMQIVSFTSSSLRKNLGYI